MKKPLYGFLSILIVWALMNDKTAIPPYVIEEVAKFITIAVSPLFGVIYLYVFASLEFVLYVAGSLSSYSYTTDFVILRAFVFVMHLTTGYIMLHARTSHYRLWLFPLTLIPGVLIHWSWNHGPLQQVVVNIMRLIIGADTAPIF